MPPVDADSAQNISMTSISIDAVVIADRTRAGEILCSPGRCAQFAYLISIGGPSDREPAGFYNVVQRLRLVFEDVSSQASGGAAPDDIERLVAFARTVDLSKGHLLVHCQAGISRSSAAAAIVIAVRLGSGREDEALDLLWQIHPPAHPNRHMLALADEILGTGGRLAAAARRHGAAL
jgi:predicted protein tyrosine phosphatase